MKIAAAVLLFALPLATLADSFTIHPTIPGTSVRDFSRPGYNVDTDRGTIQPTIPGTSVRDFGRSGYRIERRGGRTQLQPTIPGTSIRDWSKPGYTFD